MVFLVFLEVLEMSSEVVGPGPNTREIKSLRVDPGPRACVQGLPAHDYNTTNHLPLVAPTTCPSTSRWMQLAVPAQSFAWLDETCASCQPKHVQPKRISPTKGWRPRKQAHPIDPCTGPVAHVQKLAHRHVERLNVLRTWRRAQVGRARCHGRGMGNLAGGVPAR